MTRFPRLPAALLLLAATSAFAQDEEPPEPELVHRFAGEDVAVSSYPRRVAGSPSLLLVGEGFESWSRLWRVVGAGAAGDGAAGDGAAGDGAAVDVVARVAPPGFRYSWFLESVAMGESVLIAGPSGLWRIDPTGEPLVIAPPCRPLGAAGKYTFLALADEEHGLELWRTDGTAAGTQLVKDLVPGPASSSIAPSGLRSVTVGTTLFFQADTAAHGREVWRTDGTEEGTGLAFELVEGPESLSASLVGRLPGHTLLQGYDGESHATLWISDGTSAGTRVLFRDAEPFGGSMSVLECDAYVLFTARGADGDRAIWRTDGTAEGTFVVFQGDLRGLVAHAGELGYFIVGAPTYPSVRQIWRTDGTVEGTLQVSNVVPHNPTFGGVTGGVAFGDDLVFTAATRDEGASLWRTDGTPSGTRPIVTHDHGVSVIVPSGQPNDYYPALLATTDDAIFFSGSSVAGGLDLWVSDGQPGGARRLDLAIDRSGGIGELIESSDDLYLSVLEGDLGREVWVSDGTSDGTEVVTELAEGSESSTAAQLTDFGGEVLFFGGATDEYGLRSVDVDGDTLVTVIEDGIAELSGEHLQQVGDVGFFRGRGASGYSTWATDGTAAGTEKIGGNGAGRFFEVGDRVLYFSRRASNWLDLWSTDGTLAGSSVIQDLEPESGQSRLTGMHVHEGVLYFGSNGPDTEVELWRSDGTASGTRVDADVVKGDGASFPSSFVSVGSDLYFSGLDAAGTTVLYRRDAAGSIAIAWHPGAGSSARPEGVAAVGGELLFLATVAPYGRELWITDDSADGAHLVRDIHVGDESAVPRDFLDVGEGRVVFSAYTLRHGMELWVTDGTEEGTLLAADLAPGPESSEPRDLTLVDNDLFLRANGETLGGWVPPQPLLRDLWRVPLALLDTLEEPDPLIAPAAFTALAPQGPEPGPLDPQDPIDPPPPPEEPVEPEPLDVAKLRLSLDHKRVGRDRLFLKFRVPIDCAEGLDGAPLRVDVGGVVVEVTLDQRGRAKTSQGAKVRVRRIQPRRKKEQATHLRVTVEMRRVDLSAPLADELLALPPGEKRAEREIDVDVRWCETEYAATKSLRVRQRRGVGTVKLLD